jgi:hypothetical protein
MGWLKNNWKYNNSIKNLSKNQKRRKF